MKFRRIVHLLSFGLVVTLSLASAPPAYAQSTTVTAKRLGIGLELGHGAGLSVKYATSTRSALQFGLDGYDYGRYRTYYKDHGRYYDYRYDNSFAAGSFLVHGEYLATQGHIIRAPAFTMPWYVGGGLDLGVGAGLALGIHGNIGLAAQFSSVPIDLFVEWTPRVWLVDFVQLELIGFNAGVRVWF